MVLDHLPNPYHIEITSFSPIKWADPTYWGCVYIKSLDYNTIWNSLRSSLPSTFSDQQVTQLAQHTYNLLNTAMLNGQPVCPAPYEKPDESIFSEWGDMLMSALNEVWNTIVDAFNALKNGIVEIAANVINALGIECGQTCKERLMTGLEIGITYFTGIPPTLPNFEELKEMGMDYAIELAAAEAGVPCPQECKDVLRSGLEQVFDAAFKQNQNQPGCVSENYSQAMGKAPLCLPPGVETEPVPEGLVHPAMVTLKVTNTTPGVSPLYSYADQPAYVVRLEVKVNNPHLVGKTLTYTYRYSVQKPLVEPSSDNPQSKTPLPDWMQELLETGMPETTESGFIVLHVPITGELIGSAFVSQSISIPALAPSQSVTIPVSLQPAYDYLIPQHALALYAELNNRGLTLDDVEGRFGGDNGRTYDWGCLYKSGQIQVNAKLYCLSVPPGLPGQTAPGPDSKMVPCESEAAPWVEWETSNACVP